MNLFERVWNEIKKGENVDLYLIIPVALFVATLNIFGVGQSFTAPLTLTVLALLAIAMLGSRHRNEEYIRRLNQTAETLFLRQFPDTTNSNFIRGADLWLVGVALTRPVKVFYSAMEEKLRKGQSIKVLVIDPDSEAVNMSEMRAYIRGGSARVSQEIRNSLQDFCNLRQTVPTGKLEIRTIKFPLAHSVIAVDPDTPSGTLFISNYPFRTKGGSLPKFVLRPKDGQWYDLYVEELKNLWDFGTEWTCKRPTSGSPGD